MSDRRRYKSIRERYDIDVSRAVDPVRRRRRIVSWSACLVALLASALLLLGSHRSFEARPVSAAHQLFEQDCAACHRQSFQTLGRLLTFDNSVPTVHGTSCRKCHPGKDSRDHYAWSFVEQEGADKVRLDRTGDCAECHQEHENSGRLSLVDDGHCTKCHKNLSESIAGHPRKPRPPEHETASRVTSFADDHPPFKRTSAAGSQKLRFNHALHLDPRGLPKLNPDDPHAPAQIEVLQCSACHQPDAAGEYMQAISFTEHCSRCHQLHVSDRYTPVLAGQAVPLPHVAPEEIRGVLRGRLMAYAKEAFDKPVPAGKLPPPLKHRPASQAATDRWQWVEEHLRFAESELLKPAVDREPGSPGSQAALELMCNVCHIVSPEPAPKDELVSWKIEPTGIPERWLRHGRFPHNRHADIRCIDCHFKTAPSGHQFPEFDVAELKAFYETPSGDVRQFLKDTIYASTLPENDEPDDILIPDIDVCRKCHGRPTLATATGSAPSNCVNCHNYHHAEHASERPEPPLGNEHPERVLPFLTSERADP